MKLRIKPIQQSVSSDDGRCNAHAIAISPLLKRAALSVMLLMMPLAAWAHDDDGPPVPLDPQAQKMQLTVLGVVVAAAVLVVGWYFVRRWQIMHSGATKYGSGPDQD